MNCESLRTLLPLWWVDAGVFSICTPDIFSTSFPSLAWLFLNHFFFLFNTYHEFGTMYEDKHTPLLSVNLCAQQIMAASPWTNSRGGDRTHDPQVVRRARYHRATAALNHLIFSIIHLPNTAYTDQGSFFICARYFYVSFVRNTAIHLFSRKKLALSAFEKVPCRNCHERPMMKSKNSYYYLYTLIRLYFIFITKVTH